MEIASMLILHDPVTLAHETVELLFGAKLIPALESPERIRAILKAIHASNTHSLQSVEYTPESESALAFLQALASTHDAGYLHHLETVHAQWVEKGLLEKHENILPECFPYPSSANKSPIPPKDIFARSGFYAFDMSTGICASTYDAVLASANLAYQGVRHLTQSQSQSPAKSPSGSSGPRTPSTVLALTRPPGHHCDTRRAGGYCYINNAVVAVAAFRHLHPTTTRTTILDLDFHHGNGTQEAFYARPDVQYISIHGEDEYPYYTGSASETGTPPSFIDGKPTNINLPLATGSSASDYLDKLDHALTCLEHFHPDFVVVSLGFDTFHLDPLGGFKIEKDDYAEIAARVKQRITNLSKALNKEMEIPALILLEGGYVIEKLGENLLSFLKGWEGV